MSAMESLLDIRDELAAVGLSPLLTLACVSACKSDPLIGVIGVQSWTPIRGQTEMPIINDTALHFISGLPRSGSTLLAAILRQNPNLQAGMSSPVASLVLALLRQMSQENEGAPFVTDAKREAVLRGVVAGYYADLPPGTTILDTNRAWCAKLPLIARLWPDAKVIACVRDVGWIMDSLERVHRENPLEPSRIHNFDPGGTVYGRVGALAGSDGMVGFALDALREAYFAPEATGRLLLVGYRTLTTEPAGALESASSAPYAPPLRFVDLEMLIQFDRQRFAGQHLDQAILLPEIVAASFELVGDQSGHHIDPLDGAICCDGQDRSVVDRAEDHALCVVIEAQIAEQVDGPAGNHFIINPFLVAKTQAKTLSNTWKDGRSPTSLRFLVVGCPAQLDSP